VPVQSDTETQQRDVDQQVRPIRSLRPALQRAGLVAAGVAIAIFGTGHAFAAPLPLPLHTGAPGCMTAADAQPNGKRWLSEPAMSIDPNAAYTATVETNCGTVGIALDAAHAPRTVNSFIFLSGQQYFDHTRCHRLTTQGIFVLQCGDPTGTGTGGPGYQVPDENLAGATYRAGTVAMANSGPNSNGSQFFLVYADTRLPASYTPFGRVTTGMDVLQNIATGGTRDGSPDGAPAADIVLQSVTTTNN
jgi:peptidyl-prolyl cis-trans isomerase B (cyclophilin B)